MASVYKAAVTPTLESERGKLLAVLKVLGEETRDARALGFAAFFSGLEQQGAFGWLAEAAAVLRATGGQALRCRTRSGLPGSQPALNNLGFVLHARGEYGKAARALPADPGDVPQTVPRRTLSPGTPRSGPKPQRPGRRPRMLQGEYGRSPWNSSSGALDMLLQAVPWRTLPPGATPIWPAASTTWAMSSMSREYGKAVGYYEQALDMDAAGCILPNAILWGHPDLANSLDNLGGPPGSGGVRQGPGIRPAGPGHETQALPSRSLPSGTPRSGHQPQPNLGVFSMLKGSTARRWPSTSRPWRCTANCTPPIPATPRDTPTWPSASNNLGGVLNDQGEYGKALNSSSRPWTCTTNS